MDRLSNIVMLDKFYWAQDIDYFFENSPYVSNSIVCMSVAYDNKMLEGKWRIHSKNYKMLGDYFKVNRGDWTNRISNRCMNVLKNLRQRNIDVIRSDINQLRQAYGIAPYFLNGTSHDCKNLQTSLKIKFNLENLPDNMLSSSSLEAIICSLFAMEYKNGIETKELFNMEGIKVLARKVYD